MADQPCPQPAEILCERLQAVLEVSESIALHTDLQALFHDLAVRLPRVVSFDTIGLILHSPEHHTMRLHIMETAAESRPGSEIPFVELPVDQTLGGLVWQTQRSVVVSDLDQETRAPQGVAVLKQNQIKSCSVVPLTTAYRRLGAMMFGSYKINDYNCADLAFLEQVARQVAVAVDNARNFEQVQSTQGQLRQERDHLSLLLEVNNAVVSALNLHELLNAVSASLRRLMQHEYASLSLYDAETQRLYIHALDFPVSKGLLQEGLWVPVEGSPTGRALTSGKPVFITFRDAEQFGSDVGRRILAEGLKSACCLPLIAHGRPLGTLVVASMHEETFPQQEGELLHHVANQIAIAVENAIVFGHEVARANKLAQEKRFLEEEIKTEYNFEEIVGESAALKRILKLVETVAPTDSTVLILGETGTGKELIARAIHNLSARRERVFAKVNCAAIPTGLLESELFGHERGAFTGAIAQKIGRFELADKGTLFLDEVGDIPLELQPKLLRVLQEQEFERLGSNKTIRVNVRLIAATNAGLERMVEEKKFRADLYYRLKVFPVTMPSLRDRPADIPLLVRYFAQKYGRLMKKEIRTVPNEVLTALGKYPWPGNIRELENFIERAVILSPGSELRVPLAELKAAAVTAPTNGATTLEAAEREHILKTLRETNWVIGGQAGAAAKLGMKRTTLQSRMKHLGITRSK
ncbi:MAG TPA: sigma 54-interacting transcriptional regulator [Candidatus Binatia bacterium]|jgi:formate hydrogenlyase transcriptional activator